MNLADQLGHAPSSVRALATRAAAGPPPMQDAPRALYSLEYYLYGLAVARPVNRPGILVVTSGHRLTAAASQGRLAALAPDSDRLAAWAVNPRPLAV